MKKLFILLFIALVFGVLTFSGCSCMEKATVKKKNWTVAEIAEISIPPARFQKFLQKEFGIKQDFGNPVSSDSNYTWAICMPSEKILSHQDIINGGKHPINIWWGQAGNQDYRIQHEGRNKRDNSYVIFCRPGRDPDEDMDNLSFKDVKEKGITILTLDEMLLLVRFLHLEYGIELNLGSWTISGSCAPNGNVLVLASSGDASHIYEFSVAATKYRLPFDSNTCSLRVRRAVLVAVK